MKLVEAKSLNDYKLQLTFNDGARAIIDFEAYLRKQEIYLPFLKKKKFLKFKVDHGALRWPGNILDFSTEQLRGMCV